MLRGSGTSPSAPEPRGSAAPPPTPRMHLNEPAAPATPHCSSAGETEAWGGLASLGGARHSQLPAGHPVPPCQQLVCAQGIRNTFSYIQANLLLMKNKSDPTKPQNRSPHRLPFLTFCITRGPAGREGTQHPHGPWGPGQVRGGPALALAWC